MTSARRRANVAATDIALRSVASTGHEKQMVRNSSAQVRVRLPISARRSSAGLVRVDPGQAAKLRVRLSEFRLCPAWCGYERAGSLAFP
jgi:hypothetical protein